MKIKRTYKKPSLKFGKVETVDEAKAREVFSLTSVSRHPEGQCGTKLCSYCPEPAMQRLLAGAKVETFFSIFELQSA